MKNPWLQLPKQAPFVLEIDQAKIQNHNQKANALKKIHTEMYPEPFLGNINSEIVLLNLNPGFGGEEDLLTHKSNNNFVELLKKNLSQEKLQYPFIFLDPKTEGTPGYKWWNERLKTLIEKVGREKLAKSILCLEFFPYHSEKFGFSKTIPSQEYNFHLLKNAIQNKALIISMRSKRYWETHVPELVGYKNFHELNSPQNVYITQNNCPEGYPEILKRLGL